MKQKGTPFYFIFSIAVSILLLLFLNFPGAAAVVGEPGDGGQPVRGAGAQSDLVHQPVQLGGPPERLSLVHAAPAHPL